MGNQGHGGGETPGLFLFHDGYWGPEDAEKQRNLGCPYYDDCLSAASKALAVAAESPTKKKSRHSWKLETRGRTWKCSPDCPHRHDRETFRLELLQSTPGDKQ